MRARLMMTLLLAIVVIATSAAYGAAPRKGAAARPGPMDWSMRLDKLTTELKLTPSQVAQLKQIHQNFMAATQAARANLKAKEKQMISLWEVDHPDAAAIKAAADEIENERAQIRNAGIDSMIKGLAVLTPAQRAKLRTMAQQWAQKMKKTTPEAEY